VVVQRAADLAVIGELLAKAGTQAWVNCSRRLNDFYLGVREPLGSSPPLRMGVQGGDWALGCNAIHFIDLYAFLTCARITRVDTTRLDRRWYPSKRTGFREIAGTLAVDFEDGGRLDLHSQDESREPTLVTLQCREGQAVVWEKAGRAQLSLAREKWRLAESAFRLAPQSELTHIVAERLLGSGDCGLPTYAESAALHEPFLRALLAWSGATLGEPLEAVPIT